MEVDGERRFQSYRNLVIWQKGIALTVSCYELTASMPVEEKYGLISQIRRAATSIPANIAEGHGRDQTGSFIQFLRIAQGSLKELETHIIVAKEVALMSAEQTKMPLQQCEELGKMIRSLIRTLEAK